MFATHRMGQAAVAVNVRIAIAAFVADPPLVDQRIFARLEPINAVLVFLDPDRAAGGAAGADPRVPPQKPHPLLVQKVLVAQRTDRTEIDHVSGKVVVQRMVRQHVDFFMCAAARKHQFLRAADLLREADATAAQDAAIDEQRDVADVAAAAGERLQIGPALRLAMLEMVVLQGAFTRLVANRAIDRMP